MGFWSGQRLLSEGASKSIVSPFDPDKIDCSAYTLTLGAEVYITPGYGDDPRENRKEELSPPALEEIAGKKVLKGGGQVVLPSGQFAFLLTEEIVAIPPDAMGFISLKSHSKFRGLINVSGFHVDPGFNGRLIYSVFNAGPSAIPLTRGDKIFLLWVADLAGRTDDPKYRKTKPGYADIPSSLIANVSKENHSLQALSEQINEVAEQFRVMKRVGLGVATAIGVILAAAALWPDEKDPPAQQIITVPYEARGTATSPALPPPSPTPTAAPS